MQIVSWTFSWMKRLGLRLKIIFGGNDVISFMINVQFASCSKVHYISVIIATSIAACTYHNIFYLCLLNNLLVSLNNIRTRQKGGGWA